MEDRAFTLDLLGTNEIELAYIAGLFDGEGCVNIHTSKHKSGQYHDLRVFINNTAPELLLFCSRIFGGKLRLCKRQLPEHDLYHWELYATRAETFLRAVEPYLILKKDKAALALSFRALGRGRSPAKGELAELISPHRNTSHNVNPDGLNAHST